MRSPISEEDGVAKATCDELTAGPHSPVSNTAKAGKKGEVGGRCFKICFYFSLSYSNSIGSR